MSHGLSTIDPVNMTAKEWTDAMHINLGSFGLIPSINREEEWQGWGANLSHLSSLSGMVVPNPYEFSNWQDWARRFNESLSAVS